MCVVWCCCVRGRVISIHASGCLHSDIYPCCSMLRTFMCCWESVETACQSVRLAGAAVVALCEPFVRT